MEGVIGRVVDYREVLAERIAGRWGSRHQFCGAVGWLDQGFLSRVLSGRKDFSLRSLLRIAEELGLEVVFVESVQGV